MSMYESAIMKAGHAINRHDCKAQLVCNIKLPREVLKINNHSGPHPHVAPCQSFATLAWSLTKWHLQELGIWGPHQPQSCLWGLQLSQACCVSFQPLVNAFTHGCWVQHHLPVPCLDLVHCCPPFFRRGCFCPPTSTRSTLIPEGT